MGLRKAQRALIEERVKDILEKDTTVTAPALAKRLRCSTSTIYRIQRDLGLRCDNGAMLTKREIRGAKGPRALGYVAYKAPIGESRDESYTRSRR